MTPEEKKAYAQGYQAGKRFQQNERASQEQEFLDRAFLSALPACITVEGWKFGDRQPIVDLRDRIKLAHQFAAEALRQRKIV